MKRYFLAILLFAISTNCSFAQNKNLTVSKLKEGVYKVQGNFAMELCGIGCCSTCFGPTDQILRINRYLISLNDVLNRTFNYDTVFFFGKNIRATDSTNISKYKLKYLTVDSVYFERNKSSIITVYSRYMKRRYNKIFRYLDSKQRYNGLIYYQAFKCDFIVRKVKPETLAKISPQFKKPKGKIDYDKTTKPVSYRIIKIILIEPLDINSNRKKMEVLKPRRKW